MLKGLCSVASGEVVQIIMQTSEMPEVGHYYFLESAAEGTGAQNRLFHSLTMEYFKSGMHSYNASNYHDFKNQIKRKLGEGFESFIYAEIVGDGEEYLDKAFIKEVKKKEDIPDYILEDKDMRNMVRGKLKSWSDYTLKQRKKCIDNVITEMLNAGVNTPKFEEILKGIDHEQV